MYKEHGEFRVPTDDTVVWRYIDRWKFEDLLKTSELFMSPISGMGDEFEGRISSHLIEKMKNVAAAGGNSDMAHNLDLLGDYKPFRDETFISSWNMGPRESYALWGLYTKDSESIAIKSTIKDLKHAFQSDTIYNQHIGAIHYHDGEKYTFSGNLYSMALQKFDYYEFEQEVRIVGADYRSRAGQIYTPPPFIRPAVDTNAMINEIYLSPACTVDYKTTIEELLGNYSIDAPVKYSGIKDSWLSSSKSGS